MKTIKLNKLSSAEKTGFQESKWLLFIKIRVNNVSLPLQGAGVNRSKGKRENFQETDQRKTQDLSEGI